jgi:hypothetical protein
MEIRSFFKNDFDSRVPVHTNRMSPCVVVVIGCRNSAEVNQKIALRFFLFFFFFFALLLTYICNRSRIRTNEIYVVDRLVTIKSGATLYIHPGALGEKRLLAHVQGIFRSSGSSFIYDHPFFFFFISPLQ